MNLQIDVDRVIADLDELAAASGGRFAGAKRLAWSEDWKIARAWLRGKLGHGFPSRACEPYWPGRSGS